MIILNCNILKTARRSKVTFKQNAFQIFSNILVNSKELAPENVIKLLDNIPVIWQNKSLMFQF